MAPGKTEKKRKAATVSTTAAQVPPSKKSKKSEDKSSKTQSKPTTSPAQKKALDTSGDNGVSQSLKLSGEATRNIKPRKRAADFLSDDEGDDGDAGSKLSEVKNPPVGDKTKSSKKKSKKEAKEETIAPSTTSAPAPATQDDDAKVQKGKKDKGKKEGKPHTKEVITTEPTSDVEGETGEHESEDEGEDDQTIALIKGFESSGDEDISGDEEYEVGKPVPGLPKPKKTKKKLEKLKNRDTPDEPGTVYVGRIPHGFYEKEMKAYFSQFGPITRLRLSRNRVTGRSKHYAFIEFASASVAKVVAKTMDNYLMFGHILKCRFVPEEQIHPELWKGANRRFNRTPWNRVEQFRLEGGKSREKWSKSIAAEKGKRVSKAEKMKALGYEMKLPTLKGVDEVPVQVKPGKLKDAGDVGKIEKAGEAEEAVETNAIDTAKSVNTEKDTAGKSKKKAKKNKEATQTDKKAGQVKEPEQKPDVDGTPKSEPKKRAAEADASSGGISKKSKKPNSKDVEGDESGKSNGKARRESVGDEAKPTKVKKGDKAKAKSKAKA